MARLPDFFGIDLGNSAFKVCEAKRSDNSFVIEALGSSDIPGSLLENQSDQGLENIAERINEVVKASGIKTKAVVMSLPETIIFSRLVTLPKMKDKEVDEAIHWAIKPLVPVPLETLNVSFLKIDDVQKTGKEFSNWYVVAAPKDVVQRYQVMMNKTKFELLAIETEALAITRLLFNNYQIQGDAFLVDIGADSTNLMIVRNSVVVFSQSVSTGSNSLTKAIASDYGLDETQADKYKMTFGLDFENGDGKIAKTLQPVVDLIVNEISRTLAYYTSKIGGQKVNKIFMTGGGSNLIKLSDYITQKLGIQVEMLNVLNNGKLAGKLSKQYDSKSLSSFNVALGLALKGQGQ